MEEKRTGGGKEFIFSLLWAVIFMILGQYIIFILPSYKIIGTIITILLFCILGFFRPNALCGDIYLQHKRRYCTRKPCNRSQKQRS